MDLLYIFFVIYVVKYVLVLWYWLLSFQMQFIWWLII